MAGSADTPSAVIARSPARVWIERVSLTRFRNYASLRLPLDERHVVLTGNNGAGKTNLLESVSFLSPGRGLRRAPYERVAMSDSVEDSATAGAGTLIGTWAANFDLHGAVGPVTIGTGLRATPNGPETQRRTQINKVATRTSEAVQEHVRVLWLTPSMDGLFSGAAADRRRFLDRMVLAIDPSHGTRVNAFEKAMRSRNKLLDARSFDGTWLDGLEAQMAQIGVAIASARAELIVLLTDLIETDSATDGEASAFPRAVLSMEGLLEEQARSGASGDLEDQYTTLLCRNRPRDSAAGRTLDGPHRSNLCVVHGPKDMEAAQCSTGEQKALLTGMVLAHARLVAKVSGMTPLLLLDEIAAHLDASRRAALFDLLDKINCQAWMTGTDADLFSALGERAQRFTIANGIVDVTP
ncbi:MAG: DNA replication/repair protein RecF [Pseudomonadota bacterium]